MAASPPPPSVCTKVNIDTQRYAVVVIASSKSLHCFKNFRDYYVNCLGSPIPEEDIKNLPRGKFVCATVMGSAIPYSASLEATYGKHCTNVSRDGTNSWCYPIVEVARLATKESDDTLPTDTSCSVLHVVHDLISRKMNLGFIRPEQAFCWSLAKVILQQKPEWISKYSLPDTYYALIRSIYCCVVAQPFAELIACGQKRIENRAKRYDLPFLRSTDVAHSPSKREHENSDCIYPLSKRPKAQ